MKEIKISEVMNGFTVEVAQDGEPRKYVYTRIQDLEMLEAVGKIVAERRVKVETV